MTGILAVGNGKLRGNTEFVARLGRKYSSGLEPWSMLCKNGGKSGTPFLNFHEDTAAQTL